MIPGGSRICESVWMRKGIEVRLGPGDWERLEGVIGSGNSPQKHVWRARIGLLAQRRRELLRQAAPAAAQTRRLQRHCRSPGRQQPLPGRDQQQSQAFHLDPRPRRHHRKGAARETGSRVNPLVVYACDTKLCIRPPRTTSLSRRGPARANQLHAQTKAGLKGPAVAVVATETVAENKF